MAINREKNVLNKILNMEALIRQTLNESLLEKKFSEESFEETKNNQRQTVAHCGYRKVHRMAKRQRNEPSTAKDERSKEPHQCECKCIKCECADGKTGGSREDNQSCSSHGSTFGNACGPDICAMEQLDEDFDSNLTGQDALPYLEKYNTTALPFPIKNRYLEILKVYDFPLDEIGPFEGKSPLTVDKSQKNKKTQRPSKVVNDAMEEANELFTRVGYEDELVRWLSRVYRLNPKPENPHEYLKKSANVEEATSDKEYRKYLEELSVTLAGENELAFELAQIKLLCSCIDQENFGCDGKTREDWKRRVQEMSYMRTRHIMRCYLTVYNKLNQELKGEKQRLLESAATGQVAKRKQIVQELKKWKQFVSPKLVQDRFKTHNGRIENWFSGLRVPDPPRKGQAPVHEFDEYDVYKPEDCGGFDKHRSDSMLLEDFD